MKLLPDPAEYPASRLFCLDVLRGIDMLYLSVVAIILSPLLRTLGVSEPVRMFFTGHPWGGFTLYDLIMPLFIFMAGAALPFALARRLENGRAGWGYWKHVLVRVAMLWVLGMFAQGSLQTYDLHSISPYNNTLQTIAFGYLVAAGVVLLRNRRMQVAIALSLAAAYALIVHFGGDYTKDGNVTMGIELKILNSFLPADNRQTANIVKYGYTWFLPSMMFPVITLAGCFATDILRSKNREWRKAAMLALYGAGMLAMGWLLVFMGVKMVKQIFTVSFTFQAIGYSVLLLAALYAITDIFKFRRGPGLLLLFGQFALTAYICEAMLRKECISVWKRFFEGIYRLFPASWEGVVSGVGCAAVTIVVMILRRRLAQADSTKGEK